MNNIVIIIIVKVFCRCVSIINLYKIILEPPLNNAVKNVSWLLGKWRSDDGHGVYPTIKSFKYGEEIEFTHVGQPNLQFR